MGGRQTKLNPVQSREGSKTVPGEFSKARAPQALHPFASGRLSALQQVGHLSPWLHQQRSPLLTQPRCAFTTQSWRLSPWVCTGAFGARKASFAALSLPPMVLTQVKHVRGILSMGRYDDPNSATSSFSILLGAAPHLDEKVRPRPACPPCLGYAVPPSTAACFNGAPT